MISNFYQYGDQTKLKVNLDTDKLLEELNLFEDKWSQYNTLKPWIRREGLCVINERGECGPGPALNSIYEWNDKHGTNYDELDFNIPTEVYHHSEEVQKVLKDILPHCFRTHFIRLKPGGFFPEHRDYDGLLDEQNSLRLIVPIRNVNPGSMRFIIDDKTAYWEEGCMYLINTNKVHSLFNLDPTEDSIWFIINAKINEELFHWVRSKLSVK